MTTAKKIKKNYFTGWEHDKGGIWQRVLRYFMNITIISKIKRIK